MCHQEPYDCVIHRILTRNPVTQTTLFLGKRSLNAQCAHSENLRIITRLWHELPAARKEKMRLPSRQPRPLYTHTPLITGRNSYKNLLPEAGKYSYHQQKLNGLGEWHWNMCIITCETDRQSRLMHETGCSGLVPWDDPEGWDGEGGSGWGTHIHPWLIHVNVWQKPPQYCKVISLQLK